MVKAKTKKVGKKGRKKVVRKSVMEASALGVSPAQLVSPATFASLPPLNLSTEPLEGHVPFYHLPLVAPRTSFWLGVGVGIVMVGMLGYLAWQLYNVEIAEALVLGLPSE